MRHEKNGRSKEVPKKKGKFRKSSPSRVGTLRELLKGAGRGKNADRYAASFYSKWLKKARGGWKLKTRTVEKQANRVRGARKKLSYLVSKRKTVQMLRAIKKI